MKPLKTIDKQALEDWDAYLKSIRKDTAVDLDMPYEERQKRLTYLEKHPLLWIKEMFPNYAKYEFASFHKKAIKRLIYSPKTGTRFCLGHASWPRARSSCSLSSSLY